MLPEAARVRRRRQDLHLAHRLRPALNAACPSPERYACGALKLSFDAPLIHQARRAASAAQGRVRPDRAVPRERLRQGWPRSDSTLAHGHAR
ncbi:hypothetical protein PsYK624_135480 [Phanerochaete sordida]|uniref:Uncharacterized protein n=1 Tax=Phanerochaete sordida TaxID=48140 RepID=A0A9P3LKK2_9APHY|nr:hypothetical protein PsYK624_135480 [Phanerochaete sordida]